ncbi:hypothetical protein D1P53_005621 [Cryptococcus gattii VGV]|nr:hypothetical protein D1P53_005621 [Cryptococcus gattii VGV]
MGTSVHVVLLIHGLWGSPAHLRAAKEELEAAWGEGEGEELVVMVAGGMTSQLTYDGIDVCASRVAWELDEKVKELEAHGKHVAKFSLTGYSLGGRMCDDSPAALAALADFPQSSQGTSSASSTPALPPSSTSTNPSHSPPSLLPCVPLLPLAMSRADPMISQHYGIPRYILCWLGARIMSRSGEQLYVVDKYSGDDPRPLLEIMADPRASRLVYTPNQDGKLRNLRTSTLASPHPTLETDTTGMNRINDNSVPYPTAAIETSDHFAQWQDQRLIVDYNDAGIIRSWSREQQDYPPHEKERKGKEKGRVVKKSLGTYIGTLPPVLRYRFPFNYLTGWIFNDYSLARQSLDTSRSKRRLQQLAQTSSPPTPSPSGLSIQHLRATIRHIERNLESEFIESIDGPALDIYDNNTPLDQVVIKVQLKESQFRMALWLNQLPFKKYLTWWPEVTNAHATAIVRDAHLFPQHERGRGMLKFWAQVMLGQATDVS